MREGEGGRGKGSCKRYRLNEIIVHRVFDCVMNVDGMKKKEKKNERKKKEGNKGS